MATVAWDPPSAVTGTQVHRWSQQLPSSVLRRASSRERAGRAVGSKGCVSRGQDWGANGTAGFGAGCAMMTKAEAKCTSCCSTRVAARRVGDRRRGRESVCENHVSMVLFLVWVWLRNGMTPEDGPWSMGQKRVKESVFSPCYPSPRIDLVVWDARSRIHAAPLLWWCRW